MSVSTHRAVVDGAENQVKRELKSVLPVLLGGVHKAGEISEVSAKSSGLRPRNSLLRSHLEGVLLLVRLVRDGSDLSSEGSGELKISSEC